jgi:hypothetical protein
MLDKPHANTKGEMDWVTLSNNKSPFYMNHHRPVPPPQPKNAAHRALHANAINYASNAVPPNSNVSNPNINASNPNINASNPNINIMGGPAGGNPNNFTTGSGGDSAGFTEWDKQLIKLPSAQRIESIFAKMRLFDVRNTLPPKLEYTPTAADAALQHNIRALFPAADVKQQDSVSDVVCTALLAIAAKTDDFMSIKQKSMVSKQQSSLNKEQQRMVLAFYPCLMALIRTLLIHCQNLAMNAKEMGGTSKYQDASSSMHKCVMDMWQQVMGELHDLHAVIIYASSKSLLDLGEFPVEWLQTIQSMNSDINHLRSIVLVLNDSLNQEQMQLNERDKKLQQIMAQYAEADTKVQLIKAQKNNILATLESLTSVPNITSENIPRIQAAFSGR